MVNITPLILETDVTLGQAYNQFNTELQKMLNAVAPRKIIKQLINQKTHSSTNTSGNKGK